MTLSVRSFAAALAAALVTIVPAAPRAQALVGPPDPEVRAVIDAFVAAITSGQADQFEAVAQQRFAPEVLARGTPQTRRAMAERIKTDYGTLTVQGVRILDGVTTIDVRGSTGLAGRFELSLDPAAPHRITRVAILDGDGPGPQGPPAPVRPDMTPAAMTAALDGFVAPHVADDTFAGVVIIAKNGEPVVQKAYGLADRESGRAATVATRYSLGSINKLVTRTAIAQLLSAGKLALTDAIGTLLPDYPNPAAKVATVQQLLEHQGGIADFFGPAFDAADKTTFRANADYYRFVAPMPLRHDPGAKREYCNGCYIVLGAIVEKVTGMPYELSLIHI